MNMQCYVYFILRIYEWYGHCVCVDIVSILLYFTSMHWHMHFLIYLTQGRLKLVWNSNSGLCETKLNLRKFVTMHSMVGIMDGDAI